METVTVYTRERGNAPADLPFSDRILNIALHDIVIPPPRPLAIGLHVKLYVLRAKPGHQSEADDPHSAPQYSAEPTGITGPIIGIRAMELAVTELIVQNDAYQSTIEHAYLAVPHIHGQTIDLGILWRAARIFLLPLLHHTRHVRLQENAVITRRVCRFPGPDEEFLIRGEEGSDKDGIDGR